MNLGMTPFTLFHVVLSLMGIAAGPIALAGMLQSKRLPGCTALFLATTLATTVTGFLFPFNGFTPAIGVGIVSLLILAVAIASLYVFDLVGRWRGVYVTTSVLTLYLDVFVLVVHMFGKVPALHALAPTQKEPPFAIAQGLVLVLFVAWGAIALRRFRQPARVAVRLAAS